MQPVLTAASAYIQDGLRQFRSLLAIPRSHDESPLPHTSCLLPPPVRLHICALRLLLLHAPSPTRQQVATRFLFCGVGPLAWGHTPPTVSTDSLPSQMRGRWARWAPFLQVPREVRLLAHEDPLGDLTRAYTKALAVWTGEAFTPPLVPTQTSPYCAVIPILRQALWNMPQRTLPLHTPVRCAIRGSRQWALSYDAATDVITYSHAPTYVHPKSGVVTLSAESPRGLAEALAVLCPVAGHEIPDDICARRAALRALLMRTDVPPRSPTRLVGIGLPLEDTTTGPQSGECGDLVVVWGARMPSRAVEAGPDARAERAAAIRDMASTHEYGALLHGDSVAPRETQPTFPFSFGMAMQQHLTPLHKRLYTPVYAVSSAAIQATGDPVVRALDEEGRVLLVTTDTPHELLDRTITYGRNVFVVSEDHLDAWPATPSHYAEEYVCWCVLKGDVYVLMTRKTHESLRVALTMRRCRAVRLAQTVSRGV